VALRVFQMLSVNLPSLSYTKIGIFREQVSKYPRGTMKLAAEFDEINGRFQPINDMLTLCRQKARDTHDADYLALVQAVQALSNRVRDLERNLLLAEDQRFRVVRAA
jgi:hypothetical protein